MKQKAWYSEKQYAINGYCIYRIDGKETVITQIGDSPAWDDVKYLGEVETSDFVKSYIKESPFRKHWNL